MNRNEIIRLAREAGLNVTDPAIELLQKFATTVIAAEREAIWNILFEYSARSDLSDSDQSLLKHLADLIQARGER